MAHLMTGKVVSWSMVALASTLGMTLWGIAYAAGALCSSWSSLGCDCTVAIPSHGSRAPLLMHKHACLPSSLSCTHVPASTCQSS